MMQTTIEDLIRDVESDLEADRAPSRDRGPVMRLLARLFIDRIPKPTKSPSLENVLCDIHDTLVCAEFPAGVLNDNEAVRRTNDALESIRYWYIEAMAGRARQELDGRELYLLYSIAARALGLACLANGPWFESHKRALNCSFGKCPSGKMLNAGVAGP